MTSPFPPTPPASMSRVRSASPVRRGVPKSLPIGALAGIAWVIALAPSATAQRTEKREEPKLRKVPIETRDGIKLNAFYWPTVGGKDSPVALILHEWEGQSSPYGPLVQQLHAADIAVLALDYRGHGGSDKEVVAPGGRTTKLNPSQMSRRDVEAVVAMDIESAKGFLRDENNDENVNLNALAVIGVGQGAILGAHFAARDWAFPSRGRVKQGQDVKAMVLVSPDRQLKGVPLDAPMRDPNLIQLPVMVVYGTESSEASEARRLASKLNAVKKKLGRGTVSNLETLEVPTSLSDAPLVTSAGPVIPAVVKFIQESVPVGDGQNEWVERR